ncbi:MAG: GNAT family N-acetyltransferase [Yoonia sp.]|jgi:ribosomal protein S18 acetylase RimI-like enzyme|nr:GNAT family N-acetyltransferase [Yoonia sp.]
MIRPATLDDVDGLKAAVIAAYAPYADKGVGLPPVAEGLDDDIRDNYVWVAEDRGLILGGVVLVLRDGVAYVANLAVHPIGEGQGLGRKLIDIATSAANDAGYGHVGLSTHKDMTGTQAFYARLGWTETARQGDKVTFTLELT